MKFLNRIQYFILIVSKAIVLVFLFFIYLYKKFLSPLLGPSCRFYPSCSSYAQICLKKRGLKSLPSILWRLLRCGPWSRGGVDIP